jgi:hypothetical protein
MEMPSYGTLKRHCPIQSSSFLRSFDYKKHTYWTTPYFKKGEETWQMIAVAFSSKLMLQPFLRYNKKCHFPTTLSTFFLTSSVFLKSILFSLFLFVRLRKWTLSQRVETCNGVKWRLASPGDSDGPAKPTLLDGNVLTERRSDRTVRGEIRSESMK